MRTASLTLLGLLHAGVVTAAPLRHFDRWEELGNPATHAATVMVAEKGADLVRGE